MFRQMIAVQQVARRSFSSSVRRQFENKVRENQKRFQNDDGLPVHLKAGYRDRLLYRLTMVLTVWGVGYTVYELGKASMK